MEVNTATPAMSDTTATLKNGVEFDFKEPDYKDIILKRAKMLSDIRSDKKFFAACMQHYKSGAEGCIDFIQDWMFTYDPRRAGLKNVPFILWERQKEYIGWLWGKYTQQDSGLVEKSRDAGATYLNVAFSIWLWLFFDGAKVGFGSRKEALVDKIGDPDSIFEKMRMILRSLPDEILPVAFSQRNHTSHMKIINPENGASITGEAGDNIGRGGRNSIYFKDESAFYERPKLIEASLSQNSDCKIDVSTPNGMGNIFYQKRHAGVIDVFVFDWRQDPRKDQDWYDGQKASLDSVVLAQEVDRDYGASADGICIPAKWVTAAINYKLSTSGENSAGLDVADEGSDSNALIIGKGSVVTSIEEWKEGNTAQTTKKAWSRMKECGCHILKYDKIGVGAGVKGETSNKGYATLIAIPVDSAAKPSPGYYLPPTKGMKGRKNRDMFLNFRAEMWWKLRKRFEKVYEMVNGINTHPVDDLISIPNDPQLTSELSQVKYKFSGSGKIQIESKADMKRRGLKSPNKADALAIRFAPKYKKRAGTWGKK